MTADARRRAEAAGRRAETIAAWYLRAKGYRVLARGEKSRVGEIDLIVRRGRTVAFVEVKRRESRAAAILAVSPRQRARIAAAAERFIAGRADLARCDMRFDIVAVGGGLVPTHLADAWRPGF